MLLYAHINCNILITFLSAQQLKHNDKFVTPTEIYTTFLLICQDEALLNEFNYDK
jgi:hypothetical protein